MSFKSALSHINWAQHTHTFSKKCPRNSWSRRCWQPWSRLRGTPGPCWTRCVRLSRPTGSHIWASRTTPIPADRWSNLRWTRRSSLMTWPPSPSPRTPRGAPTSSISPSQVPIIQRECHKMDCAGCCPVSSVFGPINGQSCSWGKNFRNFEKDP